MARYYPLPDPEFCRCGTRGHVIHTERKQGYRRRRMGCRECGHRWTTYLSVISPRKVRFVQREPKAIAQS